MPFQSEKQRRYLWANEPEIARDWTDTYGSRIKKDDGGIMRTGFFTAGLAAGDNISPGTTTGSKARDRSQKDDMRTREYQPTKGDYIDRKIKKDFIDKSKKEKQKLTFRETLKQSQINRNKVLAMRKMNLMKDPGIGLWSGIFKGLSGKVPAWAKDMTEEELMQIATSGPYLSQQKSKWDASQFGEGKELLGKVFEGGPFNTGNVNTGGDGPQGYMGYPSYAAWLAAQGQGGTTEVAEVVEETPSDFQKSLTGTEDTPGYYVGSDPTAANKAWGKAYGVDPRTMGMTSFAADGGRIPAAFGGIMDTDTGRRAYGFGSFFKKIGRAAKKVFKSPIGKMALMAGAGYLGGGGGMPGWMGGKGLGGFQMKTLFSKKNPLLFTDEKFSPWKGIGLASALPFVMGDQEEDESSNFDYEDAKTKYWNEIMGIKKGVAEGTLKNPHDWSYLPSDYIDNRAEGGRIGLYAGGQSVPSDYTMEDAMMTTTQDKLGGITDVMKQADLSRAGSVGQFYAAQGGRIGFAGGMNEKLAELKKAYNTYIEGGGTLSFEKFSAAFAEENFAQGGRIGAQEGGLMDLGGMEKDYRNDGGFVPLGGEEKADDVPARLSKNEFVFTADAVRGAGDGDIDKGAEIMENIMKNLEQGGQISEETQGLSGAQEMFGVSERLSEVV